MKRAATIRQGDVSRAIRAATAAGLQIARVEIAPDGNVTIVTPAGDAQDAPEPTPAAAIDLELTRALGARQ